MGGLAFASGPDALFTPRMSREVYLQVKAQCFEILRDLYDVVESPIDGPGKSDFGDVDIALCGPKQHMASLNTRDALKRMSEALGATRMLYSKGEGAASNMAIPWPKMLVGEDVAAVPEGDLNLSQSADKTQQESTEPSTSSSTAQAPRYVQVDIDIFPDVQRLNWVLFKHAHGDIWNLIGATIRPYGLTVDQNALSVRIPEIEPHNSKKAKVFLTSDHTEILEFLGLSPSTYFQGEFESLDAMYEYVAQSRMFWVRPEQAQPADDAAVSDGQNASLPNQEGRASVDDEARWSLKSNDRRRMNYRPAFRKWIDEFKPECRRQGRFSTQQTTREEITAEAMARFHIGEEYERRRRDFIVEKQRDRIWTDLIKNSIPPADPSQPESITYRGCLIKALKRIILKDSREYGIHRPEGCQGEDDGLFDLDMIQEFIQTHKDAVGKVAYDKQYKAYKLKKAEKAEKKPEESGVVGPEAVSDDAASASKGTTHAQLDSEE